MKTDLSAFAYHAAVVVIVVLFLFLYSRLILLTVNLRNTVILHICITFVNDLISL